MVTHEHEPIDDVPDTTTFPVKDSIGVTSIRLTIAEAIAYLLDGEEVMILNAAGDGDFVGYRISDILSEDQIKIVSKDNIEVLDEEADSDLRTFLENYSQLEYWVTS